MFTIGANSEIGAVSVVLKEVPPNATVVGIPGKAVMIEAIRTEAKRPDHQDISDPVGDRLIF